MYIYHEAYKHAYLYTYVCVHKCVCVCVFTKVVSIPSALTVFPASQLLLRVIILLLKTIFYIPVYPLLN